MTGGHGHQRQRHGLPQRGGRLHRGGRLCGYRQHQRRRQPDHLGDRQCRRVRQPTVLQLRPGAGATPSYFSYALGFSKVTGTAGGPGAVAYMGMSTLPGGGDSTDTYTADNTISANHPQRTDTIMGTGAGGGPVYTDEAIGFGFAAVYAANHTVDTATIANATGDFFLGTYSYDAVTNATLPYQVYLIGFPKVTADGTGAANTGADLQQFAAGDFLSPLTGTAGDFSQESSGTNYDNIVQHFSVITVSVFPN